LSLRRNFERYVVPIEIAEPVGYGKGGGVDSSRTREGATTRTREAAQRGKGGKGWKRSAKGEKKNGGVTNTMQKIIED